MPVWIRRTSFKNIIAFWKKSWLSFNFNKLMKFAGVLFSRAVVGAPRICIYFNLFREREKGHRPVFSLTVKLISSRLLSSASVTPRLHYTAGYASIDNQNILYNFAINKDNNCTFLGIPPLIIHKTEQYIMMKRFHLLATIAIVFLFAECGNIPRELAFSWWGLSGI